MSSFCLVSCSFCIPEMSNSRLGAGRLSLEEERPILTEEGLLDKDSWVDSLKSYLTTMKERTPDVNHPSMEWIT